MRNERSLLSNSQMFTVGTLARFPALAAAFEARSAHDRQVLGGAMDWARAYDDRE
jgi:hypothetical protein